MSKMPKSARKAQYSVCVKAHKNLHNKFGIEEIRSMSIQQLNDLMLQYLRMEANNCDNTPIERHVATQLVVGMEKLQK